MSDLNLLNNEKWRHLPLDYGVAGIQLARSEALFTGLAEGGPPTLHWYITTSPALVLGLNQKETLIDQVACAERGIEVYRRRAGGNIVYLSSEFLSLDIALPANHYLNRSDIVLAYEWVGNLWTRTLHALGIDTARTLPVAEARHYSTESRARLSLNKESGEVDAQMTRRSERDRLANLFCFGTLAPFESVVPSLAWELPPRKLAGLCQIRRRGGTIWQCGLPLRWEPDLLGSLIALEADERPVLAETLRERATGVHDLGMTWLYQPTIMQAFNTTLENSYNITLHEEKWTSNEEAMARNLYQTQYLPLA